MHLGKSAKVAIGIGTLWVILYPLLFIGAWFFMMFAIILSAASTPRNVQSPPSVFVWFPVFMFVAIAVQMLGGLVQIIMSGLYLVHVIKNTAGSEVLRVILGVGTFFLPFIAMPAYYLIYMWPERPPEWALERRVASNPLPAPNPSS